MAVFFKVDLAVDDDDSVVFEHGLLRVYPTENEGFSKFAIAINHLIARDL